MRWVLAVAVGLAGCRSGQPAAVDAGSCECPTVAAATSAPGPVRAPSRNEPTAQAPQVTPLSVCDAGGKLPLDAALGWFDEGAFEKALSCAAQAAALSPGDVLAHTTRGNALAALGRFDEARLAYARALAMEPESLDALAGAARLYAVLLPSSREVDELGSVLAERGLDLARSQRDDEMARYFARVSALAFNDIGQPEDALERADWVLERHRGDAEALYERAVALFELCRFDEAKGAFTRLLGDRERAPFSHHHLGLIAEREGRQREADEHFAKASSLDAESFPPPVPMPPAEFREALAAAVASLPEDMRRDLAGVPVSAEELPSLEDLTADEPPLSPTILGLFRGPPLGEPCADGGVGGACRAIVVYRKNLARAATSREGLLEQLRVTLLHELGHLRGEDDYELAARGLE